uniref:BED-type domain-containing protein n=1 Tax=Ditylenchus dipsaci TaxID=166011 RepID=A0A915EGF9_9BILA
MEDSPATKRAKRRGKVSALGDIDEEYDQVAEWDSKQFGGCFDEKIENGKPSLKVVCKQVGCRAILRKAGTTNLCYHMKLHQDSGPPSEQQMNEALLKFTVTSGQPTNLMDDQFFIS